MSNQNKKELSKTEQEPENLELRIAFDLDGTLYDTLPFSFEAENLLLARYGLPAITLDTLKTIFQSTNFDQYYLSLGVTNPEQRKKMIDEFYPLFNALGLPRLIPGAKKLLNLVEQTYGQDGLSFVTNATPENFQARFQRDGLEKYLPIVRNAKQGKAHLLKELADLNPSIGLIYVGDLVCDGEECLKARENGANENLIFVGLTHQYAFSPAEKMEAFVRQHQDFARTISSLEKLGRLLYRMKKIYSNVIFFPN
jgi:phosphoglycolate phosphatase-like HAD superfamily hydrolase